MMTLGPRLMWNASRMISSAQPMSSAATPTLLIRDISLTPIMFTTVVKITRPVARMTAFFAPSGVV